MGPLHATPSLAYIKSHIQDYKKICCSELSEVPGQLLAFAMS